MNKNLVAIALALGAAYYFLVYKQNNTVPTRTGAGGAPPPAKTPGAPPVPTTAGFSPSGAGTTQAAPGSTLTTINNSLAVANNALGFFNELPSLWDDSGDGGE